MGSGKLIKRAQQKYGIENFKKENLQFFPTYKEALNAERLLVTPEFIEESTNYNLKEGGFGGCIWSTEFKEYLSQKAKERWSNEKFQQKMVAVYQNEERNKKIGIGRKKWIEQHPEEFRQTILSINTNEEKIEKTRQKHLGKKRSKEACKNIKQGIQQALKIDSKKRDNRSSKGKVYIYHEATDTIKRVDPNLLIPVGWRSGSRLMKGKRMYGREMRDY